jgi:hypothetical protein
LGGRESVDWFPVVVQDLVKLGRPGHEYQIGELHPLARAVLGSHLPLPLFFVGDPAECGVEATVGVLEDEFNLVAGTCAVAQGFGETSAVDIQPVSDVAFARVVLADHDVGFVGRRRCNVFLVNLQELVVDHPLGLDRVFHTLAPNHAG